MHIENQLWKVIGGVARVGLTVLYLWLDPRSVAGKSTASLISIGLNVAHMAGSHASGERSQGDLGTAHYCLFLPSMTAERRGMLSRIFPAGSTHPTHDLNS